MRTPTEKLPEAGGAATAVEVEHGLSAREEVGNRSQTAD